MTGRTAGRCFMLIPAHKNYTHRGSALCPQVSTWYLRDSNTPTQCAAVNGFPGWGRTGHLLQSGTVVCFGQHWLWFGVSVSGTFVPMQPSGDCFSPLQRKSWHFTGPGCSLHVFCVCVYIYRESWMNGCFMRLILFIYGLSSEISVPDCTQTQIKEKLLLFLKTRKGASTF